jgi:hypothetical protein
MAELLQPQYQMRMPNLALFERSIQSETLTLTLTLALFERSIQSETDRAHALSLILLSDVISAVADRARAYH